VEDTESGRSLYGLAPEKELSAFGFNVRVKKKNKAVASALQSVFLNTNTHNELLVVTTDEFIARYIPPAHTLKIKLEVDTDPPPGFSTESR